MTMRFLITGGTGNTGSRVAKALAGEDTSGRQGATVRIASRTPAPGTRQVRFDWADAATHAPALTGVDGVYLVPPVGDAEPARLMVPFLERALAAGVRRFVLLSSSAIAEGGPGVGEVHRALRELAPEWAVLRPSWFMQNFVAPGHLHGESIRTADEIVTATGPGRVAFVDADDIAAVAVRALTDERPHNAAHLITGPQALSYADIAEAVSGVSGRDVRHRSVSVAVFRERLVTAGIPEAFARLLAAMDDSIAHGSEDRVDPAVERVTGRAPRSFADFAARHAAAWTPAP
ncbi:oxidoreductase [Streptomyces longisporoflavus]|uniref:NmrA family NAD(P)-binding protein n=1 Tax=Streptomyces longisporoflavus TaxID=28044 RepID=UPI00167DCA8D|nr:NAD(P)H-binding protein [Streptomyces longisporoflavus]GGV36223.1 oxidoreductase [Streptomyces longisporoflavus]